MTREPLNLGEAQTFAEVGIALGIPLVRSDVVPRGTFLIERPRPRATATRVIVGTHADPLESVRREARRIVQDGIALAGLLPRSEARRIRDQREADGLVDKLAGPLPEPR